MSNEKMIQENLNLYNYLVLDYVIKEKEIKDELKSVLTDINAIKLSKFKPKLKLKSTVLENLFPELKTSLSFIFENCEIIIEKDSVRVRYPREARQLYPEFRMFPKFMTHFENLTEKEEENIITIKEIKEIDDVVKLYLMQKLINLKEPIELKSISIFAAIKMFNEPNFEKLNQLIKEGANSKKEYDIQTFELDIKDQENSYTVYFDKKLNFFMGFSKMRMNIKWIDPLINILNDNIINYKKIWGDLGI